MKMYEAAPGHFIPEGQTLATMYQGDSMADQVLSITGRFMDEPEPSLHPTETTWVTKENEEIPVVEMEDPHLINTIRMLRQKADLMRLAECSAMMRYQETAPDGAYDAVEHEMQMMENMPPDQYLARAIKCFPLMLQEAARRNLNLEVPPISE